MARADTSRKPHVSPQVPTRAIDRYLGRTHVSTPNADILAAIRSAPGLTTDPGWTPALLRQTERYALWRHHRNQADYAWVMGSHA